MSNICRRRGSYFRELLDLVNSQPASVGYVGSELATRRGVEASDGFQSQKSGASKGVNRKLGDNSLCLKKPKVDFLREVEQMMRVSRSQIVVSSKANNIYHTDEGDVVIIDKGVEGAPSIVTLKEKDQVNIKVVKYFEDNLYLFPVFDESNVHGRIIFMDQFQIWYQQGDNVSVVAFENDTPDIIRIKIDKIRHLNKYKTVKYIENYKFLYYNEKIKDILASKQVETEDIIVLSKELVIVSGLKNKDYKVLLFDKNQEIYDELIVNSLPQISEEAMKALFSKDIVDYIKKNKYNIEKFRQNGEHIEYNLLIGKKNVCVMRFRY